MFGLMPKFLHFWVDAVMGRRSPIFIAMPLRLSAYSSWRLQSRGTSIWYVSAPPAKNNITTALYGFGLGDGGLGSFGCRVPEVADSPSVWNSGVKRMAFWAAWVFFPSAAPSNASLTTFVDVGVRRPPVSSRFSSFTASSDVGASEWFNCPFMQPFLRRGARSPQLWQKEMPWSTTLVNPLRKFT